MTIPIGSPSVFFFGFFSSFIGIRSESSTLVIARRWRERFATGARMTSESASAARKAAGHTSTSGASVSQN
jgi:hypothetical protein